MGWRRADGASNTQASVRIPGPGDPASAHRGSVGRRKVLRKSLPALPVGAAPARHGPSLCARRQRHGLEPPLELSCKEPVWTFRGHPLGAAGSSCSTAASPSAPSCGHPGAAWAQTGGAPRGPRLGLDRLGAARPAGDRGARPRHPGAGADPLHLGGHGRPGRAAAGGGGGGGQARDGAPCAEQPRRPAGSARIRAPAHRLPRRPGEPQGESRVEPAQPGGPGGGRPRCVPRCQAERRGRRVARGEAADRAQRGQPRPRPRRGAGDPVQGRAGAARGDDQRRRLAALPAGRRRSTGCAT